MRNKILSGFICATVLFLSFCEKKSARELNRFWDCNASQHLDSARLAEKLTGSWKWKKVYTIEGDKRADKKVVVMFEDDGKFSVKENSTLVTEGDWSLKILDAGVPGLSINPQSKYLNGRILFCDNEVMFNDSYRDGTDNVFRRLK